MWGEKEREREREREREAERERKRVRKRERERENREENVIQGELPCVNNCVSVNKGDSQKTGS